LQTRVAAYRSYVIAVHLENQDIPTGLFWDTEDPYNYIRSYGELAIIGGRDHKTGQEDEAETRYELDFAHDTFGFIYFGEHELSKPIRLFAYHCHLNRCEKYGLCFELNTNGSERVLLRCAKSSLSKE